MGVNVPVAIEQYLINYTMNQRLERDDKNENNDIKNYDDRKRENDRNNRNYHNRKDTDCAV